MARSFSSKPAAETAHESRPPGVSEKSHSISKSSSAAALTKTLCAFLPASTTGRLPPSPRASRARYSMARTAREEPSHEYSVFPLPNRDAAFFWLSSIIPSAQ